MDLYSYEILLLYLGQDPLSVGLYATGLTFLAFLVYYGLLPPDVVKDSSTPNRDKRPQSRDHPPVYPNGWIPVAESRDVTADTVTKSRIFTNDVVLFRDASQKVCALDAYCPHLGAHMGYGGKVVQDNDTTCIKCPFHGWVFRATDGSCVKVPYTQDCKPPPGIKVKTYNCVERNGFVFLWYHSDGDEPSWLPPIVPEVQSGKWQYGGRTEDTINCHFQEVPENGADIAHLTALHESSVLLGRHFGSWSEVNLAQFLCGRHEWGASWTPAPAPETHCADVTLCQKFFMFNMNMLRVRFDIKQVGPLFVILRFTSPSFGGFEGVYLQAITPLDVNKQRIVHHVYMNQSLLGKFWSKFFLHGQSGMLERDILMWNNKKFMKNPVLVKEEKTIAKFRQWYTQFYTVNSPRTFESVYEW